jgi:hypothetical protein
MTHVDTIGAMMNIDKGAGPYCGNAEQDNGNSFSSMLNMIREGPIVAMRNMTWCPSNMAMLNVTIWPFPEAKLDKNPLASLLLVFAKP